MEESSVLVRMDRPGVVACGPYRANEIYAVTAAEAERLVAVKGFRYVTDAEDIDEG